MTRVLNILERMDIEGLARLFVVDMAASAVARSERPREGAEDLEVAVMVAMAIWRVYGPVVLTDEDGERLPERPEGLLGLAAGGHCGGAHGGVGYQGGAGAAAQPQLGRAAARKRGEGPAC